MLNESAIQTLVNSAIEKKVFPGAALAVLKNGQTALHKAYGHFTYDIASAGVSVDTIYDIASVTKEFIATAILQLVDSGRINLHEQIEHHIPALSGTVAGSITIWHLLTHTSGIGVHMSKLAANSDETILKFIRNNQLRFEPGAHVAYSNINTYLLGKIIAAVTSASLQAFLFGNIWQPLGMRHTSYCPLPQFRSAIPPTEIIGSETIQGIVHDESARLLGGEVGHAGVFSTVTDLVSFLFEWIRPEPTILSEAMVTKAVSNQTPGLNLALGLGWHLDNPRYLGSRFTRGTFFHPGFTGSLIAGNRSTGFGLVFLANCTYPHREGNALKDAFFESLLDELAG
ncbi:beta-lactamase family protein [Candidatus Parcubacteria bacterium]|nr:beta-lactamase family protein [Candidatus Parcubacteria bacterium]